jgi:manganese/iron transport system ATP-binding protein
MLGLIPVQQGSVNYQGQSLQQQLDKVAYVPQRTQIDLELIPSPLGMW